MKLSITTLASSPLAIGDLEYDREDRADTRGRRAPAPAPEALPAWIHRARRELGVSLAAARATLAVATPVARRLRMSRRDAWEALASGRSVGDLEAAVRVIEGRPVSPSAPVRRRADGLRGASDGRTGAD